MKINSIGVLNSTTLRSKEKCGLNCKPKSDRQKVSFIDESSVKLF